jgi:hypothetical protein
MKMTRSVTPAVAMVLLLARPALPAQVDVSACRGMYEVLEAMRGGASRETVSARLDALLHSRPYQVMFRHYNRSWRPNHLPPDVFKRMILSLRFPDAYRAGENERADTMRQRWTKFYPDLAAYEGQLRQLESADLPRLIAEGVRYAQGWLPDGWTIPDFYFPVVPNGGSPAFTIDDAQGYDFLQLSRAGSGQIDLQWLVGTIAHESHHLGMRSTTPAPLTPPEAMAYSVVNLCVPEGAATAFISGPPEGCAPAVPGVPFHVFTPELTAPWKQHVAEEAAILARQVALLDRAAAGRLTEEELAAEMRDYWLAGSVGPGLRPRGGHVRGDPPGLRQGEGPVRAPGPAHPLQGLQRRARREARGARALSSRPGRRGPPGPRHRKARGDQSRALSATIRATSASTALRALASRDDSA